jgi:hypothetical protein
MKNAAHRNVPRRLNVYAAGAAFVLTAMLAGCTPRNLGSNAPPSEGSSDGARARGGGGSTGGPADSCASNAAIGTACVCGGAVHETGYCCEEGFSFSGCSTRGRYVRPGGGGAQDGSDWVNAFNGLPGSLERDTVYWVGAGSYSSYTFDDSASGQAGITVRKATASAHGTDAGWNAAYGSGQAVFGPLRFNSSRYTVDGTEPNGIKAVGQMGTTAAADIGSSHIVLRHVEIDGGVQKSNNTQTAGGCMGGKLSGNYVVLDRCDIHNVADDGLDISGDHIKVLYSKVHDLHGCGTDAQCSGPCYNGHSDGIEFTGVTDLQLIGNMVYDGQSNAALFMWGADNHDFVAYNNVFYTPATGASIYLKHLHGAKLHNNVIWGRTNGNRFGGLFIGPEVTDLQMYNNIILCINYSHMGASHDPNEHDLDYNLFGMINSGEYTANTNDVIANPQFVGVPMSSDRSAHKGADLRLEDFVPTAPEAIDTGTSSGQVPAYDIVGQTRPHGDAWDRGAFEATP